MMVAIVACLLFATTQTPYAKDTGAVVFNATISPGRCRIPLSLGGKSYLFILDTGIEHSYVRGDFKSEILKADPNANIQIGGADLPVAQLETAKSSVYLEQPRIAGIIGMDVLSKVSFGVDYGTKQVTVWSSTSKQEDMEKAFFKSSEKTATIPLIAEQGYQSLFMNTSLGESELDTGAAVSLLPKTAAKSDDVLATSISAPLELFEGTAGKATQVVVQKLSLGDESILSQPMLLSDRADVGVISPNLLGKRVLFDMPHRFVEFAVPTNSERACTALSALLHGAVEERNGELYVQTQSVKNLGATADQWAKIVSIDQRPGAEWLKLYKGQDEFAATALRHAYDALSKGGPVIVEQNGKRTRLLIAPFIR